jgi:hypothetical protein
MKTIFYQIAERTQDNTSIDLFSMNKLNTAYTEDTEK